MISKELEEVCKFADRILRKYFCESDIEFLISTFAPDIVWVGGGEKMIAEGARDVAESFRKGQEDAIACDMYDERYLPRKLGEGHYLCQCDSWLLSKKETGMYLHMHQRCTFVFRRNGDKLETVHIHNSMPSEAIQDDELFPVQASKEAYQRLEKVLAQRESQIELMLSQLPGGLLCCSLEEPYFILRVHEGISEVLGYESTEEFLEAVGHCYINVVHPEDRERLRREVQNALAGGEGYYAEYRARTKDGRILWVADFGKPVAEDGQSQAYLNCFISDISRRKERELEMERISRETRQQARFLSQLYDSVPCGILQFSTDPSHEVGIVNPMVWRFYGFQSEEEYRAVVKNPFQLVLPKERAALEERIGRLVLDGPPLIYTREARKKDGAPVWLSVAMQRIVNANGKEVYQAVFTDVTAIKTLQKAQEDARILENTILRTAISTAYPMILSVNLTEDSYNCFIQEQNIGPLRFRQGSYSQIIEGGRAKAYPAYRKDIEKKFSVDKVLEEFQKGIREIYLEFQQMGEDDTYHWVSIQLIHVDNPVGEDVIAIMLVKSLDEMRAEKARQEQLLRDALAAAESANRAKSDFLSRMSHDIRTPMNAIIGMTAIGQLKLDDPVRVKDSFQKIDSSSRYLLSLINDILDMSKIESGKIELSRNRFDLTEMIGEINTIIYPQAQEQGILFEIRHREPLERLYQGDVLRLKQILMNLLSNAVKFTPEGGSITVDLREVRRTNGYAYLEFQVSDTGIGMSQAFMKRIFKPFEQESAEIARNNVGSGLGLAIVYNLVQLMNGEIQVESRQGEGSCFTVTLPLELVYKDEAREFQRKSRELLRGIQVMVVDDDPLIGVQTAEILREIGAKSLWAESGRRAVELVREGLSQGIIYNIIMVDWRMPGMDGMETTREIRKLVGPETTIIIISAYDWSAIEAEARKAGASGFIAKPLFRSTIYDTFLNLEMERPAGRSEIQAEEEVSSGFRLLLVDDNALNLEIAQTLLEMNGYKTDTAENGKIAVDKYLSAPRGTYLAVLMDIRMPVMDGLEATRRIRACGREDGCTIPIFAMTANAFEEDKSLAMTAGITDYLVKPLDMSQLLAKLEEVKNYR